MDDGQFQDVNNTKTARKKKAFVQEISNYFSRPSGDASPEADRDRSTPCSMPSISRSMSSLLKLAPKPPLSIISAIDSTIRLKSVYSQRRQPSQMHFRTDDRVTRFERYHPPSLVVISRPMAADGANSQVSCSGTAECNAIDQDVAHQRNIFHYENMQATAARSLDSMPDAASIPRPRWQKKRWPGVQGRV